jgi:hypothetical protein
MRASTLLILAELIRVSLLRRGFGLRPTHRPASIFYCRCHLFCFCRVACLRARLYLLETWAGLGGRGNLLEGLSPHGLRAQPFLQACQVEGIEPTWDKWAQPLLSDMAHGS